MTFVDANTALQRLRFCDLSEAGLEGLLKFDLSFAHCYNPNDEAKIRKVIDAVGTDLFVTKIRNVAKMLAGLSKVSLSTAAS